MTMILQLLAAAVAVGLGVDAKLGTPPYKQFVQAVVEAAETLEKNVLSMEGNIPLLNDSRRHYAEIAYVVYFYGVQYGGKYGGPDDKYYESYPIYLNISAPQAIKHPEVVVQDIRKIQNDVHNNIDELKDLINACVQETVVCNELIDDTVKENEDQYGHAAEVLNAAARVAAIINKSNEKIEAVAKDLKAHQYVCTSPEDFEEIVTAIANLHQVMDNLM